MVNQTWPGVNDWSRDAARLGVYADCPIHTFHNYTPGELCGVDALTDLQRLFTSFGAPHTATWFDEGWIFIPSSLDYPARELIEQSPVEVADLITRTAVNLLEAGLERFIPFFIGYEEHGRSYWDWVGSGTEWWDDHGNPTVAVGVYNVLCHFIGRSHPVARIETPGALVQVFEDERRGAGVAVAWATQADAQLAIAIPGLQVLDAMGNDLPYAGKAIQLAGAGRPYWLVAPAGMDGEHLAASVARVAVAKAANLGPPAGWAGTKPGTSDGNPSPASLNGQWRVNQVWPDDPLDAANYHPLTWNGTEWQANEHAFGGQPSVDTTKTAVRLSCRAVWSGNPGEKIAALSFIAPSAGRYRLRIAPALSEWEGKGSTVELRVIMCPASGHGSLIMALPIKDGETGDLHTDAIPLQAGERLVLVPHFTRLACRRHLRAARSAPWSVNEAQEPRATAAASSRRDSKHLARSSPPCVRAHHAAGVHGAGALMPTVRELTAELSVSIPTVSRALAQLIDQGFITTDGRRGTHVVAIIRPHRHRCALVLPEMPDRRGPLCQPALAGAGGGGTPPGREPTRPDRDFSCPQPPSRDGGSPAPRLRRSRPALGWLGALRTVPGRRMARPRCHRPADHRRRGRDPTQPGRDPPRPVGFPPAGAHASVRTRVPTTRGGDGRLNRRTPIHRRAARPGAWPRPPASGAPGAHRPAQRPWLGAPCRRGCDAGATRATSGCAAGVRRQPGR
jgi:DNA-binding transcriptional ArsR family regulator